MALRLYQTINLIALDEASTTRFGAWQHVTRIVKAKWRNLISKCKQMIANIWMFSLSPLVSWRFHHRMSTVSFETPTQHCMPQNEKKKKEFHQNIIKILLHDGVLINIYLKTKPFLLFTFFFYFSGFFLSFSRSFDGELSTKVEELDTLLGLIRWFIGWQKVGPRKINDWEFHL